MTTPDADLTRLVGDLAARVPGIDAVVILRRDGEVVAAAGGLGDPGTEVLAAMAAGILSLAGGAAKHLAGGQVGQVFMDLSGKYVFITPADDYGALAVIATREADMGALARETTILSHRLAGRVPGPRASLAR
jgi:predicted regulator of Ras-like GTPase activity (Roadblock/LC7/MglB family)